MKPAIPGNIKRGKMTISLPLDVMKALRLTAAATGREMSQVTAEALMLHKDVKDWHRKLNPDLPGCESCGRSWSDEKQEPT